MTMLKALNTAVRRLGTSRTPTVRAAALVLAHLRDHLSQGAEVERVERVKIPGETPSGWLTRQIGPGSQTG